MKYSLAAGIVLLAGAAWAQQVHLRSSTPRGFVVAEATRTTPVRIVTDAPHQLSDGELIYIANVYGNTAANGLRYARTAGLPADQFTLYYDAAFQTPVQANGAYKAGDGASRDSRGGTAIGGKVAPFQLRAQPVGWFDGPDGRVMRDIALGAASGLESLRVEGGVATVTTRGAHRRKQGDKVGVWNSGNAALDNGGQPYTVEVAGESVYRFETGAPDGDYTSENVRISAFGHTGNPMWNRVVTAGDLMLGQYENYGYSDLPGFCAVPAIRWLVDPSKTEHRDLGLWCLRNIERIAGANFPCDQSKNWCGNGHTDYVSFGLKYTALLYGILRDQLSAAERRLFLDKIYNDRDSGCAAMRSEPYRLDSGAVESAAGANVVLASGASPAANAYAGLTLRIVSGPGAGQSRTIQEYDGLSRTARLEQPFSPAAGNGSRYEVLATISGEEAAANGRGTAWVSANEAVRRLDVGDVLDIGDSSHRVTAVESDTRIRLFPNIPATAQPFAVVKKWKPGDCGAMWFSKHHPAYQVAHPADYPLIGGTPGSDVGNTAYTKAMGALAMAAATAADDPRALALLQDMWTNYYDNYLRTAMNAHSGYTQSGSFYTFGRTSIDVPFILFLMRNSVAGLPDLGATDPYISRHLPMLIYSWFPGSTEANGASPFPMRWGAGTGQNQLDGMSPSSSGVPNPAYLLNRGNSWSAAFRGWLDQVWKPQNAGIYNGYLASYFWFLDPNVAPAPLEEQSTQFLFRTTGLERCRTLIGSLCNPAYQYAGAVSRAGWNDPNGAHLQILASDWYPGMSNSMAGSAGGQDHEAPLAGAYRLYKGGHMLGSDSAAPGQMGEGIETGMFQDNMIVLGKGDYLALQGYEAGEHGDAEIRRWAGADPTGPANNEYVYALVDVTHYYRPATTGRPDRVHRHIAHLKKPGTDELIVAYDDISTPGGTRHASYLNYVNNGGVAQPIFGVPDPEGETTCPHPEGWNALDRVRTVVSRNSKATMITRWLSPGTVRVFVERGNQCRGRYGQPCSANQVGGVPGGEGWTFRVGYCAADANGCAQSATATEVITAHRLVDGTGEDIAFDLVGLNPSAEWTGLQSRDKVVLFARRGQVVRGVSFGTTHGGAAQYLIAGLAEGNYKVRLNGSDLTDVTVSAGDHTAYFESAAGMIEIAPVP